MADISCDILVIGAGVLGLSVAAELRARGHDVRVVDPGGPNASSVAAGMIAPAFESVLERVDADRAALLRDAAALWPEFAARSGLSLDTRPAEWRGPDAGEVAEALCRLGFPASAAGDRVTAGSDGRIDAVMALETLRGGLGAGLVVAEARSVVSTRRGWCVETTAGPIETRQLVIATGVAAALPGLPPMVRDLISGIEPIAGQIGRTEAPLTDRVVRGAGGYVAPVSAGSLIGATMVRRSRDAVPDPAESARLIEVAMRLSAAAAPEAVEWRGGVRGATADGLPLAGTVGTGLHLALAPRRNGWLLGPLVGRIVADGVEGRPRGSHATALDPLRFSPQAG
ncbi:FAD-binding oxidoreductase [Brevundimonas sp.]|uniref:NAD(P)/FAD-dependent oxidoreductase n=1 Tax=Brevundimonas sp. TaxID=1871086 RepID=UPI002624DF45|nr:FAD-binding oxidoreductase [Brevundimonas sp.]